MGGCHDIDIERETAYFYGKLKESGGRVTAQRRRLAKEIIGFHGPFSPDQLYAQLEDLKVDATTIYRSLATFVDLGLLRTVDFADGQVRYEYVSSHKPHHHHVICTTCKKVEAVHFCVVAGQEQVIEQMGYVNVSHRLEFFGTCLPCQAKSDAQKSGSSQAASPKATVSKASL